jgi:Cu(I)/Ag(I) efflux system membrane fusion protein
MKIPFALLLVLAAAAAGWFARARWVTRTPQSEPQGTAAAVERRPKYYQSAMHPWIKSDQPGKCTICGMDLTPVYEGEHGLAAEAGLVTLSSNQLTVIHVATSLVRRQPITRTLAVAGSIDDNDQQHRVLSAYVDGRIERLFVNHLGAEVVAGQPLVAIYSPMLLTAVREYLTARNSQGATLSASAAWRLRQMGLTELQIAALPDSFSSTNLTVEVVAPMTGTVVAKEVYEGQYVKEGDKLFELADFSTMWFLFDAYERDLAWLQPGQVVEITAPSLPGRGFTNSIAFIDPNLREDTRSAKVRVELPNPVVADEGQSRRLIRHRVYAEGRVRVVTQPVLVVPRSAVLSPGRQAVVYVERGNGAYEQRAVTLGRAGDDEWEILTGLGEGERVVTRGNLVLDSQAQLNADSQGVVLSPAGRPLAETPRLPALNSAQAAAVREFLTLADRVRDTLAADDLAGFNALAPQLHGAQPKLTAAMRDSAAWVAAVATLGAVSHFDRAPDLARARQQFHAFSLEAVAVARQARAADTNFTGLKIYQCPMTKRAFPGAPPKAEWLQFEGPVRNPYFGSEMLDCGTEVKP